MRTDTQKDEANEADRAADAPTNRPTLVLNPSHSYMRCYEMTTKRALYSKGRTLLTVWNRGEKPPEAAQPWLAFVNGVDRADGVVEVPFATSREIGIGVFEVRRMSVTMDARE